VSSDTIPADSSGSFCFIYTPTCDTTGGAAPFIGNDTICIVICDIGNDTVCTTTHVIVTVLPKPSVDSIWTHPFITYVCDTTDVIHVLQNDGFVPDPGNTQTGTYIYVYSVGAAAGQAPFSGTVSIGAGDSTILYVPNAGFIGYDTFQYVITTNGSIQLFDTGIVYVYVCKPPTPIVVNFNPGCLDTTGYVDQPDTLNILSIDTLYPATDTTIILVDTSDITGNGILIINPNLTVTFIPDSGKRGSFTFTYQVAEFVGGVIGYSNTGTVCIDIVDTAAQCTFPNGFSPNGDGYNDVFNFPCEDMYPSGSMEIFNRWGDPIWQSKGPFKGWDGTNQQGHGVPDGTYYFVYKYNDGSGRTVSRFVVVFRGSK
jgi:gliding motility-associated-like protein